MNNNSRLTQILIHWQQWGLPKKPNCIKKLDKGVSNQSYLLDSNQKLYVLRIHTVNPSYQTDRQLEFNIQNQAANLALSPRIIYCDNKQQYWLSEYIEGETLNNNNKFNDTEIKTLCNAIDSYQKTSVSLSSYSYTQQLNHYREKIIAKGGWNSQQQQRHKNKINLCKAFEQEHANTSSVLCHHDLNPNNIVRIKSSSPQFIILDWEFAVKGIACMDYGILTVELGIDSQQLAILSGFSTSKIAVAAAIYLYTCELYKQLT